PLRWDHCSGVGASLVWSRGRIAASHRQVWRLDSLGRHGLLSGRDRGSPTYKVSYRLDRDPDRCCLRAVSSRPYALARRFSPDAGGRAVIRPDLLAVGHPRLWRRDSIGVAARSPVLGGGASASFSKLKAFEAVQFAFDLALQLLASPSTLANPIPFLHEKLLALPVGFQIECGNDGIPNQNRECEIPEAPLFLWQIGFETMLVTEDQVAPLALDHQGVKGGKNVDPVG